MTVIGATGHQRLPAGVTSFLIDHVRATVRSCQPPLCVVSSLAAGADQLVAHVVLEEGGGLQAIVPSAGYEATLDADDLHSYEELLTQAAEITRLEFDEPSEAAYWAAGKEIVARCDLLVAIWDGRPARGLGGTGDVIDYARTSGKDVRVIWPSGVVRA